MALDVKIVADAEDQKAGLTISEFLEFAHQVEHNIKLGRIDHEDLLLGSIGFSAQIKRLTVNKRRKDRGMWNVA